MEGIIWKLGFVNLAVFPVTKKLASGLCILWKCNIDTVVNITCKYLINLEITNVNNSRWTLSFFYGSPILKLKEIVGGN